MSETHPAIEQSMKLCDAITTQLEDSKGQDIIRMDINALTTMTDFMIVVTGTSSRHVKALASNTVDGMREQGVRPKGIEGEESGEWILLDYGDVIVHIMQHSIRELYDLEGLWQTGFSEALLRRGPDSSD